MNHHARFGPVPAGRGPLWTAPVAALLTLALLAGCREETPPAPDIVRPIKVLTIRGAGDAGIREYPGTVKAAQTAEMAFEVPGKIIEFVYKEGQRVEEGALLARLDARDYQAQYDGAKADYENARVNFERAQKLYEEGALAALERDRRNTRMLESDARLRTARKALEDTELRAPFAGTMARKLVEDYENVLAKQPVLVLTDDSHLELKLDVPERDLAGRSATGRVDPVAVTERVRPEVVVTSLGDQRFPARITEIASTADTETRTFQVTVTFDNPPHLSILPGMTAKLIVHPSAEYAAGRGIRIPAVATGATPGDEPFVWIVDPATNTVSQRTVELGELIGSDVVVTSGLAAGDVLAISGVSQLREGMTIRPLPED